ncbi:Maf family protein [Candidatus Allofournierella merdipullorum]|uniref:Maf family protein n=1 Tax=Candidatus Allofournierella merdipullorum TaxID=2838595 RepID=UPI00374F2622
MSLILASASPRRKELLSLITTEFKVVNSDFDESALTAADPRQTAENLAFGKCMTVAREYPEDTVIGCDTVVDCGGKVFGKPKDKEDAQRMLKALSGSDHYVHTGVCVWHGGESHTFTATTRVRFFPLSDEQIEAYISTDEPYDKAGGYGIQGAAALFCEEIEGCYYNIMGLPVSRLARLLQKF